ncbi:F-box-like domain-containing protein [Criblamydia sequanensis]|uniref:Membrane protein n=1 Tax=Candidatus Criblamydia sequanensis CRIB-18 TaxID=1437425 RepID=A0A090CYT2_9BACT|nr:F-box-like domain-containing protein [Criblamydia sequanensis]CDR33862.1 putative membrane protein [Criblamydia sequanensis CRIB-18]
MNNLISLLNPFSSRYQALDQFNNLAFIHKCTVILLTSVASILTAFVFTACVFRTLVDRLKPLDLSSDHPQSKTAKSVDETFKRSLSKGEAEEDLKNFSLNEEMHLHLLSFLDPKSLRMAMQTCSEWRRVGSDNSLWEPIVRSEFPLEKKTQNLSFLAQYMNIKEVSFKTTSPEYHPIQKSFEREFFDRTTIEFPRLISKNILLQGCCPLFVRNIATGKKIFTVERDNCYAYTNSKFIIGSSKIDIIELENGDFIKTLEIVQTLNSKKISKLFIKEGKIIAIVGKEHILIWDLNTFEFIKKLDGTNLSNMLSFFFYDKWLVGFSPEGQTIWNLEQGTSLCHKGFLPLTIFEGNLIGISSVSRTLSSYNFNSGTIQELNCFSPEEYFGVRALHSDQFFLDPIRTIVFNNKLLFYTKRQIILFDLKENKAIFKLVPPLIFTKNLEFNGVIVGKKIIVTTQKIELDSFALQDKEFTQLLETLKKIAEEFTNLVVIWDKDSGALVKSFLLKINGLTLFNDTLICFDQNIVEMRNLEGNLIKKYALEDKILYLEVKQEIIAAHTKDKTIFLDFSETKEKADACSLL